MSRIAKKSVAIPSGVDVKIGADQIVVKGSGGELKMAPNALVNIELKDGALSFAPANDSREANAMSGTMRQMVNNMIQGVSQGFERKLTLVGVGYRAQAQKDSL
ncbi:MAG: 50S ribosomal protein L6, partial [Ottowia sp.]|nr:50S ribosomal protein L6 [Ottowia sp.]